MSVSVSTWAELITALENSTDDISWNGSSSLSSASLTVASEYDTNGTITVAVPSPGRVRIIDFNGLTIDTLSTTCSGTRNYHNDDSYKYVAWIHGFCAIYADYRVEIRNLTINHIMLETCRDILIRGGVNLKNVYCYDIYAPSAPSNSPWLRGSGIYNGYPLRYQSYCVIGKKEPYTYDVSFRRNWLVNAGACIFKLRTANAGIFFTSGWYTSCELDIDYTFDWETSDKTSDWDYLSVFPAAEMQWWNVTLTGTLRLKSTTLDLLMAEKLDVYRIKTQHVFVNLKTIADTGFGDLIIEPQYWFEYYGTATTTSVVTNNGNVPLTNVPSNFAVLLGDMRNLDILQARGYEANEDNGTRELQYDSTGTFYNDPEGSYYDNAGFSPRMIYSATNDGLPFLPFWYYPYGGEPTPTGNPDYNYICVFDMQTEQNGFSGNGLAILEPTQCRVTEELNGGWNLTLVHPKDKDGKWRYILEMNIIKCLGQLFIIRKVTVKNTANSQTVTAYAEHITYHLNDYWLFPGTSIAGYQGQTLINSILAQMWDVGEQGQTRYTFNITTDLNSDPTFKEWYEMPEGHTPYEMILGGNGFTSLIGGELYRDNFTVKINERMYGAEDNAFTLHPDLNLKAIEKTVDVQTFCTYFRAYDHKDGWWAVAWDPSTLPRAYPHNIVRSQNFTFDVDDEYYDMEMLVRKGKDYFGKHCAPLISFKLSVQDLKRHPDYKDFANNYRFKVGDIGKIWDENDNRYYELEITKTVKDGITGDCLEVVIGTERSFTRPATYPITLDRNYTMVAAGEYDPDNPPEPPEPPYEPTTVDIDYLYEVDNNDEITLLLYLGTAERVEVPSVSGDNKPVLRIAASCFDGALNLEAVKIPEGVEVIE